MTVDDCKRLAEVLNTIGTGGSKIRSDLRFA